MRIKPLSVVLFVAVSASAFALAQAQEESDPIGRRILPDRPDPREIPLPAIKTSLPSLPGVNDLPVRREMPDALTMNDGTKVTTIEQFRKRQQEIRTILEYYHIGRMPPSPGNVKGKEVRSELVLDGKARYRLIHLTFGPEEKLSLDIGLLTPIADGPVPGVICPEYGSPPGAVQLPHLARGPTQGRGVDVLLPPEIALAESNQPAAPTVPARPARGEGKGNGNSSGGASTAPANRRGGDTAEAFAARHAHVIARGYAYITFNYSDCAEDTTLRLADGSWAFRSTRFFPAYPGYDWGIVGGWVWGTMRVVDYLQADSLVDKTKLIVTGLSRLGKAALVSGAFDDRIAMVAPVASSGLGTPAYRFSGGPTQSTPSRGGSEGLTLMVMKYPNWFSPHLPQFWGQPDKLPYDAHWFLALAAPRPILLLEGTRDPNIAHLGEKKTWLGGQSAYALFGPGATDKLGIFWSDRPHAFGPGDWEALLTFADKHLLQKTPALPLAFNLFPADSDAIPGN